MPAIAELEANFTQSKELQANASAQATMLTLPVARS